MERKELVHGIIISAVVLGFYVLSRVLMSAQMSLLLLGVAFVLFFTEIIPIAFTAVLVPVVLSVTGILDANTAFSYFGYKWVIVFLFMFMVGEASSGQARLKKSVSLSSESPEQARFVLCSSL